MSQPGGHGAYNSSFRGHTRILDAKVSRALQTAPQGPLRSRLNSTVDVKSAEQFKTLWQKMLSMRGPDDSLPQDLVFEYWAAMSSGKACEHASWFAAAESYDSKSAWGLRLMATACATCE